MRKCIKKSNTSFIPGYKGLLFCKKALYYNDGEKTHQITNVLNNINPYTKLIMPIQNFTKISFTNSWVSQDYLDKGVAPDLITLHSILIQPRVGFIRLWKSDSSSDFYIEFLDTYNGETVGRPTDRIFKISSNTIELDGDLNFPLNFYSSDMSPRNPSELFRNYLNNSSFQDDVLTYQGEELNLKYIVITMSWQRSVEPNNVEPLTVICLDDGYTGRNWISIQAPETTGQWTGSIMADRFNSRFEDSTRHWNNIISSDYFQEEVDEIGHTEINLGLGDIKLSLEENESNCSISFLSEKDLSERNILLNCKIIASDVVRQFNPAYDINNNIYFSGNAKIELLAYSTFATKQEIFIDNNSKHLLLISQQLF